MEEREDDGDSATTKEGGLLRLLLGRGGMVGGGGGERKSRVPIQCQLKEMQLPLVVRIVAEESPSYKLHLDGSSTISYILAEPISSDEAMACKIIDVYGHERELDIAATFVPLQMKGLGPMHFLGTSNPARNAYMPVSDGYISSVSWLTLRRRDGTPISPDPVVITLHIVPVALLPHFRQ